ncbi:MAG: hypothetical protein RIB58_04850 [Phycisphaerales bacterium]
MKTSTLGCALTSTLLVMSGVANAGMLEETFECGPVFFDPHTLGVGDDQVEERVRHPTQNPNLVWGVRVEIEYEERDATGAPVFDPLSWASDLGLILEFDGVRYGFGGSRGHLGTLAGGYSLGAAMGAVDHYDVWDFDGPVSDGSGVYVHEYTFDIPMGKAAELRVFMTDTWNGNAEYRRLDVVTLKTPTPGAAALFGLSGLCMFRRRRGL